MIEEFKHFQTLGLSEEAAKVYIFLVQNPGDFTFEEISHHCGITLEDVHKAIEELLAEDFVKVVSNKFSANQPSLVFKDLIARREREFFKRSEEIRLACLSLRRVLEPIYWQTRAGIAAEELVEPLESLSEMELRTVKMIGNASEEILIETGRFDWYNKVGEVLAQAIERGAKVRVLMRITDDITERRAIELKRLGVEVRHAIEEWYPVRGTITDRKELVFLIWATRKDIPKPVCFKPHYSRNIGLINVFLDAFNSRWMRARQI